MCFQKLKNDLDAVKPAMTAFLHSQNAPPETYHWQNITEQCIKYLDHDMIDS